MPIATNDRVRFFEEIASGVILEYVKTGVVPEDTLTKEDLKTQLTTFAQDNRVALTEASLDILFGSADAIAARIDPVDIRERMADRVRSMTNEEILADVREDALISTAIVAAVKRQDELIANAKALASEILRRAIVTAVYALAVAA